MSVFLATDEQATAIEMACGGGDLTIEALAGCGKTTTLNMIANSMAGKSGVYVSFSKAIVEEAALRFPGTVECRTAHSLAYRAIGYKYKARLNGQRQRYDEVARMFKVRPLAAEIDDIPVSLEPGDIVHLCKNAVDRFCQGGDDDLTVRSIPVPEPLWSVSWKFREAFGESLLGTARLMWDDICSKKGKMRFSHNNYLKIWQLGKPRISADYILFDEAQDANGVTLAVVMDQQHCQKVFVGDSYQQIYSWNGAVNAMQQTGEGQRCWLTESWRFGSGVADVANQMLSQLGSPAVLVGRGPDSEIGKCDNPEAMLFRTNSGLLSTAFRLFDSGTTFCIVGGTADVKEFVEAAQKMQRGSRPNHASLNCFSSWEDVIAVCQSKEAESDPDLVRMVRMIEQHGCKKILAVLSAALDPERADVLLSTAHKAKGREWDSVVINGDFSQQPGEEEKRLLYVSATRSKRHLDHTSVRHLFEGVQSYE